MKNEDSNREEPIKFKKGKAKLLCSSNLSGSIRCSSRITVENNNTNGDCIGMLDEFDS